jgi:hypothetical protein
VERGRRVVPMNNCLSMRLDSVKRMVKRALANQKYLDRFYPHSVLTIYLQLGVAFEFEIDKFTRIWCNSDSSVVNEIVAIKEIFEVENKDDMTWMIELISNKRINENIDRLIYIVSTMKQ